MSIEEEARRLEITLDRLRHGDPMGTNIPPTTPIGDSKDASSPRIVEAPPPSFHVSFVDRITTIIMTPAGTK
jgi:hypothetical protein